jgi:hypothetical protein
MSHTHRNPFSVWHKNQKHESNSDSPLFYLDFVSHTNDDEKDLFLHSFAINYRQYTSSSKNSSRISYIRIYNSFSPLSVFRDRGSRIEKESKKLSDRTY